MDWFNTNTATISALSTAVQAFFAVVLTFVGLGQLWVYHRQRQTMELQAKIADDTRKLVEATIVRPNILIELIVYKSRKAVEKKIIVNFEFRIRNFGNGPAIIRRVVAYDFLSSGNRGLRASDDWPAISFPRPRDLQRLLGDRASVRVFAQVGPGVLEVKPLKIGYRYENSIIVLQAGELGLTFNYYANDATSHFDDNMSDFASDSSRKACPWLIGRISYEDFRGLKHHTQFCFRGRGNGIAEEDESGPPYNERT